MKIYKTLICIVLIIDIICAGLLVYDGIGYYNNGKWVMFPLFNMKEYKAYTDSFDNIEDARMYSEQLYTDKEFSAISAFVNCIISISLCCLPVLLLLLLWFRVIDRQIVLSSIVITAISVAIIVFIRTYLNGSYGDVVASSFFSIAYITLTDILDYVLIFIFSLPLVCLLRGKRQKE